MARPIVRRIDHLIVRADGEAYEKLMALFGEVFGLPRPWPASEHPAFTSAGFYAGNVDFELLKLKGARAKVPHAAQPGGRNSGRPHDARAHGARLYGIVFELSSPFEQLRNDLNELRARRVPYLPMPYVAEDGRAGRVTLWHNVFLGGLIGSNGWMRAIFAYKKLHPDRLWLNLMSRAKNNNPAAARFMFDTVYADGIVFAVKYDPAWRAIDTERRRSDEAFRRVGGGPLGLKRVLSVQVGVKAFERKRELWARLLAPHEQVEPGSREKAPAACWEVGSGPSVELVQDESDRIRSMVWEVSELRRAEASLEERGIPCEQGNGELRVDPRHLCGLDVRLVERRS